MAAGANQTWPNYEPRTPGMAGAGTAAFSVASLAAASLAAASFAAAFAAAERDPRPESRLNCRIL